MHDFHTHFIPPEVITWLKDNQTTINAKWTKQDNSKDPFLTINEKWGFELKKGFIDGEYYLVEQERAGVSHSLISPIPQLFLYDFPEDITTDLATLYNQALADWTNKSPQKLSALGTVPLTNPEKAAQVLNHAIQLGLEGVIIGPGLSDQMLSDDFFTPFFEE
ncbi:MAG: amidohydrolase family protein, partial [Bacillus sp. (in: firmicutes)]